MMTMPDASFEAALEEYGLTAKWEAKGRKEAVKRPQKYGMGPKQIAEAPELPLIRFLGI
jgi:hypothetical protein